MRILDGRMTSSSSSVSRRGSGGEGECRCFLESDMGGCDGGGLEFEAYFGSLMDCMPDLFIFGADCGNNGAARFQGLVVPVGFWEILDLEVLDLASGLEFVVWSSSGIELGLDGPDNLVMRVFLLNVVVESDCEDTSLPSAGAKKTGGKSGWLGTGFLIGNFETIDRSAGFETLIYLSKAPFGMPPFIIAFLAAGIALTAFFGFRKDSA